MLGKNISPRDCPDPEGGYKDFRIGELFEIKKGKRLTKSDMIPGEINFIGATDSNNGKTASIANNTHIHPANTITLTYNGSVGKAFYQIAPYWASDDVNVLYPKIDMDELLALYLLAPLIKKGRQYAYSYKWTKEKMESDTIQLPINILGKIDFDFMRSLIRELKKERMYELNTYLKVAGLENCTLTTEEKVALSLIKNGGVNMKEVIIGDLFDIVKGKRLTKSAMVSGKINFIGATSQNNGITTRIANDNFIHPKNTITVTYNGSVGEAFYQTECYWASDDVNVLHFKEILNEDLALFFLAPLKKKGKKYAYSYKWTKEKMAADKIYLPIDSSNNIDFSFMETYIHAVKKQCIARLKEEINRE